MDPRFAAHNTHREDVGRFEELDPQLRRLARLPVAWRSPLLDQLPHDVPGIYTLGGARQVGKTTLLKQWMLERLQQGAAAEAVAYITADMADDHHTLLRWLTLALDDARSCDRAWIVLDEVTYVSGWGRAIKFLADAGELERTVLILTGSDLGMLKDLRTTLPGRRGRASEVDFHLHPLSWLDAARAKRELAVADCDALCNALSDPVALSSCRGDLWERCWKSIDQYSMHGGFLTAINDAVALDSILPATFATYSDWVRGDMLKSGKREPYLREIVRAWVRRHGSQVSWNALARELSIEHPTTVSDYILLLERLDVCFVQYALREHTLTPAPKKSRKVVPTDPFIFHALDAWHRDAHDPMTQVVAPMLASKEHQSRVIESILVSHARRHWPTYYIKRNRSEVDLAIVREGETLLMEVKWRQQLRPSDAVVLANDSHALVAARTESVGHIRDVPILPIPVVLACFSRGAWPTDT